MIHYETETFELERRKKKNNTSSCKTELKCYLSFCFIARCMYACPCVHVHGYICVFTGACLDVDV